MLEKLNPEQRAAVNAAAAGGAVLILAGAGTGKTTTLIAAIAARVPGNILAVTFTNKAAKEMRDRIYAARGTVPYWCGTFHSICLKILRRERGVAGLRSDFLVFGEDEQKKILKSVFADMGLDPHDYDPARWVEIISFYKDTNKKNNNEKFGAILDAYNAELARLNAVDFADIINHTYKLLVDNPQVLARYQDMFEYIFVDEFQDTNAPQYALLRLVAAGHKNICAVGDDDQSIYSWRGAQIKNILNFGADFPGAQIFRLTRNYRSTANILNAANSLIRQNNNRLGKDLWSELGDGHKIEVAAFNSDFDEARTIANAIENDRDMRKSDFAILIRNGSLSKKFEDEFIARGIPYKLVGAQKFYDRMEIQDAIAYIRLLLYPFDDLSFLRVIARPRRGFGDKFLGDLKMLARQNKKPLFESLRDIALKPKQKAAADAFLRAFDFDWQRAAPVAAAKRVLEDSGYMKMWRESKDDAADDRIKNISELIDTVSRYETLAEFLENASLMVADDGMESQFETETADAVNVMTIHAAKGLEFDTVFMPAWEEGIFPNEMAVADGGLEEERRLAYVAITRARRHAVITNAMTRLVFGDKKYNAPSRFIGEIDNKFVQFAERRTQSAEKDYEYKPKTPVRRAPTNTMVGKMVAHGDLGRGVVIEDDNGILTIAFRDIGIKKVARQFVTFSG